MKRKKIFITGGTGFIGKEVVKLLMNSQDYDLTVLTRKNSFISPNRNLNFIRGDILDRNSFKSYIEKTDIILHIAGLSTGDENMIRKTNIDGTKNLVDLSRNKKFIFISSENVFYKNQGAYGESKKICEQLVKKLNDHLILRVSVVYGKGDYTRLGKMISLCKKWRILFIPGNGKSLMQPIFLDDVAFFILNGIINDKKGAYVLAGGTKISINEFVDRIGDTIGRRILKIHIPLFILFPFIKLNEYLLKNPIVKWTQLKNMNTKRVYDIEGTIKEFRYIPLNIDEGLKRIL